MDNVNKSLALILILIMAISSLSLMMVKPAFAQSIPMPSAPTFTVQYIDYTTYVAPTYTINPYTGQNQTTSYGGQIDNQTMEFIIKNQPFTPYTDSNGNHIGLYYNFRFKGHYGDDWTYFPFAVFNNTVTNQSQIQTTHSYGPYSGGFFVYYSASNSESTFLSIKLSTLTDYPTGTGIPNDSLVDFRVQAQIGHIDDIPSGLLAGDFYSFTGESSDWSNTQTLNVNYNSNSTASATSPNPTFTQTPISATSPTQTPSQTPTSTQTVPEFTSLTIPLLIITIVVAGLLVYFKKHKQKELNGYA